MQISKFLCTYFQSNNDFTKPKVKNIVHLILYILELIYNRIPYHRVLGQIYRNRHSLMAHILSGYVSVGLLDHYA